MGKIKMATKLRRIATTQKKLNKKRNEEERLKRENRVNNLKTLSGFSKEVVELAFSVIQKEFNNRHIDILDPAIGLQKYLESFVKKHPDGSELTILLDLDITDNDLLEARCFWSNKSFFEVEKRLHGDLMSKIRRLVSWCLAEGYEIKVRIFFMANSFRISLTISW